jgi:hypothetical protein
VIEEGPNAGIYVAYVEFNGVTTYVYFTKGDLNGQNFISPIRISVMASNAENSPIIVYFHSKLRIYYTLTDLSMKTTICSVHSDSYGDTWTELGAIVYMGSQSQLEQSIAIDKYGNVMDMVWSDDINYATTGWDLYLAYAYDGEDFFSPKCISTVQGKVHEYASSIAFGEEEIAVAYLARDDVSTKSFARIKIVNGWYDYSMDWPLNLWGPFDATYTRPCVAVAGNGIYLMGVGIYDFTAHTLDAYLVKLVGTDFPYRFDTYTIFNESAGVIDAANQGEQLYPCLTSYKQFSTEAEGFFIYRNYNDGYATSSLQPQMVFGDVKAIYFVADGTK